MYTPKEISKYLQQARLWLQGTSVMSTEVETLRQILRMADWSYYVMDNPVLADAEYDLLFKSLLNLEARHPELHHPDSPTQRVAKGLNPNFQTVQHLVPMLSLENSYAAEDLLDWDRRCRELSGIENLMYSVEPKFDGASISLIYEEDRLIRGATRGDGVQGDDITLNARQIRAIPLQAAFSTYGIQQIEIRGEVLMNKKSFAAYNELLMRDGAAPLANPRNAASGSLRLKDPAETAKRKLDVFLYHISNITWLDRNNISAAFQTHAGSLKALQELGFKTSFPHLLSFDSIDKVIEHCLKFETQRDELAYEIDGMVVKVNALELQDRIGQTSHHPRWAIAFKFKARQATSTLLQVDFQVGRTGSVTPVAKIEPVVVGGVTISSISLFNEDVVRDKQLMLGDTILIERAGDVIPYVVKSFPELRKGHEKEITFPTHCPVCHEPLLKPEGEAVWRCTSMHCEAQMIERIIHFTSKDAMDIRGLGEASVRKFYELGFLRSVEGIYQLPYDQIAQLEGFGEKSVTKLKEAIEQSKSQPLHRLLFGLGIRYVGETTAKTICRHIQQIEDLYALSAEQFAQWEDIGTKVAGALVDFFSHTDNRQLLQTLQQQGVQTRNTQTETLRGQGALSGKTFLFTGTLSMKRQEAEAMVEARGGVLLGSVSSKLHYLVVGEDAGSKLEKAKKLGTIQILSESDFLQLIQHTESTDSSTNS